MQTNPSSRHLREAPPRHINVFTKMTHLCGGTLQQMGWLFLLMGSVFSWIFIPASEAKFWFEKKADWKEVPGKVLTADATNSSENDTKVYRYLHSFQVDGQNHTGNSYTVGKRFVDGAKVTVRYDTSNPRNSFIVGTRRAVFNAWVLFVLIFPVVGLVFVIFTLLKNLRSLKLLENGAFTRGKMLAKEMTSTKINDMPVFRYEFEFTVGGRPYTAKCKTHLTGKVEDEEEEIVLYDRFNPDFNVVFDGAPTMPEITEHGTLAQAPPKRAVRLIAPVLAIGLNLFFMVSGPFFMAG